MSKSASIVVAIYFTAIIIGVLFVAMSVLPNGAAVLCAHFLDTKANDVRFSTRKNRADAASLAASANARRSPRQRHKNETLSLLQNSPREAYMAWAARTKVSFPRRLSMDPLW
jgi:hypothetical protein